MKYLGIDYGKARIGVAVSDESAIMAFPLGTVASGEKALQEIVDIARENNVVIAVVGESYNLQGAPNPIQKDIKAFTQRLQRAGVAVEFEPEFFTSAQAERQGKDKRGNTVAPQQHTDASAAALILQSYLDRKRKNG